MVVALGLVLVVLPTAPGRSGSAVVASASECNIAEAYTLTASLSVDDAADMYRPDPVAGFAWTSTSSAQVSITGVLSNISAVDDGYGDPVLTAEFAVTEPHTSRARIRHNYPAWWERWETLTLDENDTPDVVFEVDPQTCSFSLVVRSRNRWTYEDSYGLSVSSPIQFGPSFGLIGDLSSYADRVGSISMPSPPTSSQLLGNRFFFIEEDWRDLSGWNTVVSATGTFEMSWELWPLNGVRVSDVRAMHRRYPATTRWEPVSTTGGTVDGNLVQIRAKVTSLAEAAQLATAQLVDTATGRLLDRKKDFQLMPGDNQISLEWDTAGYAWDDSGGAVREREIAVRVVADSGASGREVVTVPIAPRPVVTVHGLWSNAAVWDQWRAFTAMKHQKWWSFAVGDGALLTGDLKMDTGSLDDPWATPTKRIRDNARVLDQYIEAVRRKENAWQVDVVGHSMGGLITRFYIQNIMRDRWPNETPRPIRSLIMLGTPNGGSRCADDVPSPAVSELKPSYMARFNSEVTNLRGVRTAILYGLAIPFTCTDLTISDMVVTKASALAIGTADRESRVGLLHTSMGGSSDVFETFVFPRLALGPGKIAVTRAPADRPAVPQPMREVRAATDNGQLAGEVAVGAGGRVSRAFSVSAGETPALSIIGPAGTTVELVDPSGRKWSATVGADWPIASVRADVVKPGRWKAIAEGAEGARSALGIVLAGSDRRLSTNVSVRQRVVTVRSTVTDGGDPVRGAVVRATIRREAGGETVRMILRDDGTGPDVRARDGVYSGSPGSAQRPLKGGSYAVDVEADLPVTGSGVDRFTNDLVVV